MPVRHIGERLAYPNTYYDKSFRGPYLCLWRAQSSASRVIHTNQRFRASRPVERPSAPHFLQPFVYPPSSLERRGEEL